MQLRTLPLDALKPAPYNPRKPLKPGSAAYRRLARSLAEFDLVQPIVWNERTGHVVGGHQRLEVLRHKGVESVEVAVVSLSLPREKALNVALNNSQLASDWDTEKLADLITELHALPDFDATLTGFDEKDFRDLVMAPAIDASSLTDADEPSDHVQITLEIPIAAWEPYRPHLDAFLASHPARVHVRQSRQ